MFRERKISFPSSVGYLFAENIVKMVEVDTKN